MALRTVGVRLAAEVSGYVNSLRAAKSATKDFASELDEAAKKGKLDAVASAATGMGLALAGAFGAAVTAAANFDKQMSEVGAVSNATSKEMEALRSAAIQAGADTVFSASEAAQAEAELAKAGLSTSDILGGALAGALDLASAGQMGLADAATIAAQAMNIFELHGQDVTHIADVLASAANVSAADMHGLGLGLQQVGLVAHQAGFSLEETVGVLAAFADRGLEGSDGATSLKTAIQRLVAPTDEVANLMGDLGIEVYDANGKVKSAAELAGTLQSALGKLSTEERNAAMNTIFGSDAIRAANVLYGLGKSGVEKYTDAVDQYGAAAQTAQAKTDNLAGDVERLKGSFETLAIQAGSGANSGLRVLVQAADAAVSSFSALPGPVQTTVTVLAGVSGAGLLATAGFVKVKETATDAMTALREMGPAGSRAADGLGRVGKIAGQATLWGIALYGAYEGAKLFIDFLNHDVQGTTRNVDQMAQALMHLGKTGEAIGELRAAFGGDLHRLTQGYSEFVRTQREMSPALRETSDGLRELGRAMAANNAEMAGLNKEQRKENNDFIESTKAVDKALSDLVTKGGVTQAKMAYEALAEVWTKSGRPLSELNALLPGYMKAIGDASLASAGAALGFGNVEQNARTMAGSLQDAVRAGQSLKDVFDQLNGGFINSTQAAINAEANIDALTESVKRHGNSLDIDTAAGQANVGIILKGAQLARDAAQAKYEETGSLEQARATYDQYINKLRTTADELGFNKQKTDDLFVSISKMPTLKSVSFQMPGLDDALRKAGGLRDVLNSINGSTVRASVITYYKSEIQGVRPGSNRVIGFNREGGIWHAQSGLLREPAVFSPRSPAMFAFAEPETGGEAFIPRNGNLARSRAIWSYVGENWLGMRQAGGGGTVYAPQISVTVHAGMGTDGYQLGQQIAEALRPYVQRNGGSVQMAIAGRQVT